MQNKSSMAEYDCYIGIGANLGNREDNINKAIDYIRASDRFQIINVSSLYETMPWGNTNQPAFLNGAITVRTSAPPLELLHFCQSVENDLGRVRHEHWGPRTIDLDLLYIDGIEINTSELMLPHPYMLERSFVLVPLMEIAPDLMVKGISISEHLSRLNDWKDVKKYK